MRIVPDLITLTGFDGYTSACYEHTLHRELSSRPWAYPIRYRAWSLGNPPLLLSEQLIEKKVPHLGA